MSDPGMDAAKKTKGKQQKSPPSIRSVNKEPPKDPSKQTQNKASKSDIVASSISKPLNPPKSNPQSTISAEKSCALCENPVNERMVQCNTCDVWHHFSCVGVSEDIKGYNWTCLKCDTAKAAKGAIPRKMMTRAAAAKGVKKANRKEGQTDGVNEQTKEADELAGAVGGSAPSLKASRAGSVVSAASRKSAKARLDVELQQIKAEEELMREEMQRKRELAKKKFEVLKEMADLEGSGESAVDQPNVVNKVEHWLKRHSEIREKGKQSYKEARDYDSEDGVETEASSEISASGSESDSDEETSTDNGADRDGRADGAQSVGELVGRRHLRPKMTSTRKVPKGGSSNRSGTERQQSLRSDRKLSKDELAARQVVPRELPKFNGNPEEWPMFVSTYEDTSAMCGYTDAENMIRLRNCLKGDAFNAVRSFLMRPETVGRAISALKLRFGRPETIIDYLKEKIIAMPIIKPDAMDKLVDFALEVQNLCATIEACGEKQYMCDTTLLKEFEKKLPPQLRLDWARYKRKLRKVKLSTFSRWIYNLAEDVNVVFEPQYRGSKTQEFRAVRKEKYVNTHAEVPVKERSQPARTTQQSAIVGSGDNKPCPACKGDCKCLAKCKRFLELSYESKWATVRGFNFCRKCLRQHKGGCNSGECGKNGCTFKHHVLLHKDFAAPATTSKDTSNVGGSPKQNEERNVNTHRSDTGPGSFRYLPVTLFGDGVQVSCHAFLDDGSELTLIDQQLAEDLKLFGTVLPLCLKWTGGTHRYESDSQSINVEICGKDGKRMLLQDVRTVEELQLPYQSLDMDQLSERHGYLRGLPVDSYCNVRPRILIGLKHANLMLVRRSREGKMGEPIAVKTNLGWTVYGGWASQDSSSTASHTYHICSCNEPDLTHLNQMVKDYFSMDSLVVQPSHAGRLSKDDERAMALLESRTHFNGERYEAGLLWRSDKIRLPDNKAVAVRRWRCLEKRMEKDTELASILHEKIAEYRSKNYIRKLTSEELSTKYERVWYLPIFPVYNPNKPGKVRIVWDAAAEAYGISLNSVLLTGPDQLASLVGILYQFREHRIGVCADIREMFHQVDINPEDQQCQRFLWRDRDEHGDPSIYVMQVMTFGASCSPATAQFVKNKNAERFEEEYPTAVAVIKKRHYVDDMVFSVETEQEAVELAESVRFIHMEGGFEIRNWVSNSPLVLSTMNGEESTEKDLNISAEVASQKILGMWWHTKDDVFKYKICWTRFDSALLDGSRCPTKREILRTLMTIYDPLGLIDHFLVLLKILLQEVWRASVDWDERIPDNLFEKWRDWLQLLPEVEKLRIPRCYRQVVSSLDAAFIEVHVFVDASESAMAAAVFLRLVEGNQVECSLIAAKTRVAPLKYTSIPRLELQAAVYGCRLAKNVIGNLTVNISKCTYWTDSRNVLCWLKADHKRYSAFVGSRVSEIQESTDVREWRWVPTRSNVADDGTRWRDRLDLSASSRWFKGPEFLMQAEENWPTLPQKLLSTEEEMRPSVLLHFKVPEPAIDVGRFSSWRRLLAVTGYVLRFCLNLQRRRSQHPLRTGPLSSEELREAEEHHYRQAQRDVYQDEVAALETKESTIKRIPKTSPLYKLSPFVDESGVMRMKGRTTVCAYLHSDAKNPVILPPRHPVTSLILVHYHEKFLHRNYEIVVNEVRQKYSIFRLRQALAAIRRNCQWCKNRDVLPQPPEMADLPAARLSAYTRPFAHVGVDYFGPIEVTVGRRVEKRWGVLLTCLTVRAVHIEVAHSLTTSSCIMALRNFTARRGTPVSFYSDRGTNFVGANRELQETMEAVNQNQVMREFVTSSTAWQFNPPAAPHMGGSWERLIQSVKRNLVEVLHARRPTDEELRNALTEIEGVLNARPLTHVPIDDEAAPALTPNHFLLGSSDGSKPLSLIDADTAALRRGHPTSQWLANLFWKRWVRDYLPDITRRTKWHEQAKPLQVGDVVVIVDPEHPRSCWPKGRVIGVTSSGRQTRKATVQTLHGIYERPTVKLAVLDVRREME
ncbi:uncharacterized protein LOC115255509 [Aedes albopictus]|uniref:Uncharacterized protein n=1 Tax=Aedes albopictus TaxID=7160 RepID=A0ABM2A271_AEDAL